MVAEVLGFEHNEALILGQAVAGLNAYSKGVSLGSSSGLRLDRKTALEGEMVSIKLSSRIARYIRSSALYGGDCNGRRYRVQEL